MPYKPDEEFVNDAIAKLPEYGVVFFATNNALQNSRDRLGDALAEFVEKSNVVVLGLFTNAWEGGFAFVFAFVFAFMLFTVLNSFFFRFCAARQVERKTL